MAPNFANAVANTEGGSTFTSKTEYHCVTGYDTEDDPLSLTCQADGRWSSGSMTCAGRVYQVVKAIYANINALTINTKLFCTYTSLAVI